MKQNPFRKTFIFLTLFIILINLYTPTLGKELSTEKMKKYMSLYNEKEPFRALMYSMVIPGTGSLYAEKPSNFIITWVIIGASIIAADDMSLYTETKIGRGKIIYNYGVVTGYIYGLVTAWMDTDSYNRKLIEKSYNDNNPKSNIIVAKGKDNESRLLLNLSFGF